VLVDVSDTSMAASGTTKKVTLNQLLGAGGTASLASATITGALTVGTGANSAVQKAAILGGYTVFENSAGTGNPSITFNNDIDTGIRNPAANTLVFDAGGFEQYRIAALGVFTWADGAGGTRMTLNSTGLGVGAIPSNYRLYVSAAFASGLNGAYIESGEFNRKSLVVNHTNPGVTSNLFEVQKVGTAQFLVDSSGNVGVGVTPSAWTTYTALQVSNGSIANYSPTQDLRISSNAYYASGAWKRIAAAYATQYLMDGSSGTHQWYVAATGAANSTITTFSSAAMTLDASGNLLVGTTGNGTSARTIISQASGSFPALYLSGGAGTTPLINFNGSGRVRSDGNYLTIETTNASGVIYMTANTNGVYLAVGGTSWTANSDERLKDIIEPISNAVSKVGSLRSVIGKFKTDSEGTRRTFLIAQDVQKVLPEAVDASNPDRLGVGYSEVIPLLVAAIKELTARVQTLEAR
jgi:hypothetical protein